MFFTNKILQDSVDNFLSYQQNLLNCFYLAMVKIAVKKSYIRIHNPNDFKNLTAGEFSVQRIICGRNFQDDPISRYYVNLLTDKQTPSIERSQAEMKRGTVLLGYKVEIQTEDPGTYTE